MDLDPDPTDSESIGPEEDHDQPSESQELTELKTFIEAGLDGLDSSISQQLAVISQHIQALTIAAQTGHGRSDTNITSTSRVSLAVVSKIVVMLMAFGMILGFPKSIRETFRLGVTRGREYRFKQRSS